MSDDSPGKIGTALRIRLPEDYKAAHVRAEALEQSLTMAKFNERVMLPMVARQASRMLLQPNPAADYLMEGYAPPPPLSWWKRWPLQIKWAIGTKLIRWGRALDGDDDRDWY